MIGLDAPADYKELIDTFGAGAFNNYMQILGLGERIQAFNLTENALYWDEYLKEEWEDLPESMPDQLQGRTFTVVNWATTEDGTQLFWIAESGKPSSQWRIAFYNDAGDRWEFHQQTTVEVLTALTRGELPTSLIPAFPPGEPVSYTQYR
ncbi:hypothetical protein L0U85_12030 [Glycomyces sp. L485]|uniref:hypothetical protein n=1 Tax=Glycomyces sp. L485 TaxID=2909235 RepID=UPI001F4AB81E|nr:hypothetical protein [Glycomyces sp. L485]MCH7231573.1 hypothetical protein [Glycomyces sp. L485]